MIRILLRAGAIAGTLFLVPGTGTLPALAQGEAAVAPQPAPPVVTVAPVVEAEMVNRVAVSGSLVARQEVLVFPEVSGFTIETLAVDVGDHVAQGDVLATLNARALTAQLAQAEAERSRADAAVNQARSQITSAQATATQAETALNRTQRLRDAGTATQVQLDDATAGAQTADAAVASAQDGLAVAQAQVQQAQAQLEVAQLDLDHATLRAPVAGVISARNGQLGAIAASGGEPIFRMIRDGEVEVEAEVIETALGQVKVGDPVELDIAGTGKVQGSVRRLSPTVDPVTRLGTVRIALDAQQSLRTGVYASGWIVTDRHEALAVPVTAVLTDEDGTYVLTVDDKVLHKQTIDAGLIWQDLREVISGLDKTDTVVAKAGAFYGDGDTISPAPAAADSAGATE